MVPPDLIDYIRGQSAEGVPAEDMRVALMEAGWSEHDVENALHDVAAGLQPLTTGASLHEDVAQVRGLVAHLASRVQRLEASLTGAPAMLTMPEELPSATIGPERELTAPKGTGIMVRLLSAAGALVALGLFGFYFEKLVARSQQAPMLFIQASVLVGFLHLLLGYFMMRRRNAWSAQLASAAAVAFWAVAAWHGWRTYHYMEGSTAAAIGALLVVLLLVMGRWIDRYSTGH